ncbi:CAP domain-containing protein [Kitasatospora camelliae]|uniref:CAP domain-containing protein n=1 Tax=Kitasatospora camelliae TaxID=3156397 RepID=A0AAU8K720_9ACTN
MDGERTTALVERAWTGDGEATAELIGGHLPLVHNVVGRALSGRPGSADAVRETARRAVDGLPGLGDPAGFRPWLLALAVSRVRHARETAGPADPFDPLSGLTGAQDPGSDFVNLTIVQLGLYDQHRELAEATRWLDEGDRDLLALWWLEASGHITRSELSAALELSAEQAASRVQKMRGRLDISRVVVRALAMTPLCPWLGQALAGWDGIPSAPWRKLVAQHARDCAGCSYLRDGLLPAEGLLAGLALVPVPEEDEREVLARVSAYGPRVPRAQRRAGNGPGRGGRRRAAPKRRGKAVVTGALVLTVAAAGVMASGLLDPPGGSGGVAEPPAPLEVAAAATEAPAVDGTATAPSPNASATATPTASPAPSASGSPAAAPSAATTTAPATGPAAPKALPGSPSGKSVDAIRQQVLDLVNQERGRNGCSPVKGNAQLDAAAQAHSDDMAARGFFDHTNPDGEGPQPRIERAGYRWSRWGENIARGQKDAAAVMNSWMNSPGHRANILNCNFTELGIGVHLGPGGPWWTQDFGTPR